ncbi:tetratricopeptide repeat protein [Aestuariivirga sp.]|uniref:tetratricopeptide repeat protein n=1 Tax=Aestuariivirga sp. TaxID=2650926 RepID=UPI0035941F52
MSDESLFREVDEEVRQEQFKKLWARYGNLIMGLCFLVIAGVAGFQGWTYWKLKQAQAAGETFFSAVKLQDAGKSDEALTQFASIGHAGYAVLARLREAGTLLDQGKTADAVNIYDAIAAEASTDGTLRDLARIRAAAALVDTVSPADLEARVKTFDVAGNPWRHTAREIMASSHWRARDYTAADKAVQAILGDPEAPASLRQRAQMLSELLLPLLAQK